MLKGLRSRIILVQSVVIAVTLFLMAIIIYQIQKNSIIEQFLDEAKLTETIVKSQLHIYKLNTPLDIMNNVNVATVSPFFSRIMLISNENKTGISELKKSLPPLFSERIDAILKTCKTDFLNMSNMRILFVAPIYTDSNTCINLVAISNSSYLIKKLLLLMEILGAYVGLNFFILTIISWFIIDRYTVRPLYKLKQAVEGVSNGYYPNIKDMPGAIELHEIAKSFNIMSTTIQTKEQRLRDTIRELKETQALIIKREKLATIGSFASAISHEIGNPLSAIISMLELIKTTILTDIKNSDHLTQPSLEQTLDIITRSLNEAYRIDTLIKQLLLYVRQKPLNISNVHINTLVEDVVTSANMAKPFNNIKVISEIKPDTVFKTDYEKLRQVLLNLITNAIDAMQFGGTLNIKAVIKGSELILEVSDTGEGIDNKDLDKIFEPFFTTKGAGKGTGLGLAIVKNIIQELNGEITVNSQKDIGTSFTVKLPSL